ncbi:hypothetical protein F3Y22_tig00112501pilonHSYRG00075 [Hibiscus syriacus]|uniref:RNase H type-1 domain-containing protein n=1 Tax=Hibiscus syriacus TaxID=106335 RepID=A0A6A2XGP7_HIBSY|nr:hypothetical protein F3Y22_tig00112501pilonHSYRG00075 [Hibiscus syriacus]
MWIGPPLGSLTFNVDGAIRGSYGPAGIGGILKDHNGIVLAKFSRSAGHSAPSGAELQAVLEDCHRFLESSWFPSFRLIIESYSSLVISWINTPHNAPSCFSVDCRYCFQLLPKFSWRIQTVPRCVNNEANTLAKAGIRLSPQVNL